LPIRRAEQAQIDKMRRIDADTAQGFGKRRRKLSVDEE
jgi:hypothetical protein